MVPVIAGIVAMMPHVCFLVLSPQHNSLRIGAYFCLCGGMKPPPPPACAHREQVLTVK
jgi:hypothetical protein